MVGGMAERGRTPEPWLGPDLGAELRHLAATGVRAVVVCPVGFVADHLEVLYDIDIEAAAVAASAGLSRFGRTASLNDDPRFVAVLADVVETAAGGGLVDGRAATDGGGGGRRDLGPGRRLGARAAPARRQGRRAAARRSSWSSARAHRRQAAGP